MPTFRDNPYGAFNYIVSIGGAQGDGALGTVIGGFSDVSGLGMEVSYSDYRNGSEKFNTTRKVPNTHKLDDVTLKRGIVGSDDLFTWLKGVRDGVADPRQVTIKLLDEARITSDFAQRKAIYERLTKVILEDNPKLYLHHRRILIAHTARLEGYKQMPDGLVRVVGLRLK